MQTFHAEKRERPLPGIGGSRGRRWRTPPQRDQILSFLHTNFHGTSLRWTLAPLLWGHEIRRIIWQISCGFHVKSSRFHADFVWISHEIQQMSCGFHLKSTRFHEIWQISHEIWQISCEICQICEIHHISCEICQILKDQLPRNGKPYNCLSLPVWLIMESSYLCNVSLAL